MRSIAFIFSLVMALPTTACMDSGGSRVPLDDGAEDDQAAHWRAVAEGVKV